MPISSSLQSTLRNAPRPNPLHRPFTVRRRTLAPSHPRPHPRSEHIHSQRTAEWDSPSNSPSSCSRCWGESTPHGLVPRCVCQTRRCWRTWSPRRWIDFLRCRISTMREWPCWPRRSLRVPLRPPPTLAHLRSPCTADTWNSPLNSSRPSCWAHCGASWKVNAPLSRGVELAFALAWSLASATS
jgi:hypothetical protein